MKTLEIGIIGFGNMGSAIAEQMKKSSFNSKKIKIIAYDRDTGKTKNIHDINIVADIKTLVQEAQIVILAVKPQDLESVLREIKDSVVKGKTIISIAAGVTTGYIERILGEIKVVRVMPNMPSKIGKGVIGLCKGKFVSDSRLKGITDLFYALGQVMIIEERLMDAFTAVSGSGPAYICEFLEKENLNPQNILKEKKKVFLRQLKEAAEAAGFSSKDATFLVEGTFAGTITYLKKTGIAPAGLKKQVTSKGGTTEAALEILNEGGSLIDAVKAAVQRAKELSKG